MGDINISVKGTKRLKTAGKYCDGDIFITAEGGGSSGENKLAKVIDRTVTEITASDLEGATAIGNYAFYYFTGLTSITIPNSVTSIGDYAFRNCTGLKSITIPDSVTSIGDEAFRDCMGLTSSLNIPNSVTSIGKSLFSNCNALTYVIVGAGVTSFPTSTFNNCDNLKNIVVCGDIQTIENSAFGYNYKLECVDFTACTSVPTLTNVSGFANLPSTCEIRVPPHLVAEWRSATNWSTYASQIVGYIEPSETERKVFTLAYFGHTSTLTNNNTFFFEEGMTWGEWKSTAYNTLIAYRNDEKFGTHINADGITIDVGVFIDTPVEGITYADGTPVKDSEVIDESTAYEFRDLDYYIPQ